MKPFVKVKATKSTTNKQLWPPENSIDIPELRQTRATLRTTHI